ncbi:replicative DNA helicase [Limimonas halophila]|uniref:Replicative DNA helicase n=1 Tax=Limimonas halophila TaxID=1082479 RepID=A0A1G7MEB9_9PROT|nr:replicative DNA helicase [Limimonas halophila]SDF60025.1 replicative DNA helicase [Limimonas halophila]
MASAALDQSQTAERTPPVNYEAEQALLAAILANNQAYERVADFLRADHFADAVHGRIYAACAKLIDRGQIANAVTLKNVFERDNALQDVGGSQYLTDLQNAHVTAINAEHYGRTIHDLHLRRQLIALGEDIVNEAFDYNLDSRATEQIEATEQKLFQLAETGQSEGDFKAFSTALTQAVTQAESAHRRQGQIAGVTTGLEDLDQLLGGLHNTDLIVLAGRPGMGKTALATNISFNAARRRVDRGENEGAVVGFFSLEMAAEQLATRILSEQSGIDSENIRRGKISSEDFESVVQASHELSTLPFYIDDTPAISVGQVRQRARRLKRQHNLGMIVVDYLQLMQPTAGSKPESRVQEISEITRGLKVIAKELDVPVLALSQLSRAVEQREDKRPQLADLRESGTIEQDADVVMFVYREEYYLAKQEPAQRADESDEKLQERIDKWKQKMERAYGVAEAIVAKQRHGPTGQVKLAFDGGTTRFGNLAAEDQFPDEG